MHAYRRAQLKEQRRTVLVVLGNARPPALVSISLGIISQRIIISRPRMQQSLHSAVKNCNNTNLTLQIPVRCSSDGQRFFFLFLFRPLLDDLSSVHRIAHNSARQASTRPAAPLPAAPPSITSPQHIESTAFTRPLHTRYPMRGAKEVATVSRENLSVSSKGQQQQRAQRIIRRSTRTHTYTSSQSRTPGGPVI